MAEYEELRRLGTPADDEYGFTEREWTRFVDALDPHALPALLDRLEEAERLLRQANQQHVYRHFGQKCDCESCTFGDEIDDFLTTHTGEPNG